MTEPQQPIDNIATERTPLTAAVTVRPGAEPVSILPIGTVTFLFSDVVGSSPVTERRGDRQAREFYRRHDLVIRRLATELEGHIVRQDGDGFFISFRSTRQALRCAIRIQRGLAQAYSGDSERPRVRIGMHVGETIEEGGDYYGTAVNLAARVRGEAGADQIVVSDLVRSLASGEPEFRYRFLIETVLRGFQGRVRLYELLWRESEIAAASDSSVADSDPDAADLRRYAQDLGAWTVGDDLSEWSGRYVGLSGRVATGRGVLASQEVRLTLDLQECIDRYLRLMIAGEIGSGKTTALLEAARRAARLLEADQSNVIPVFVQVRTWRKGQDFIDILQESVAAHGLVRGRGVLTDWLQMGRFLLILDGHNELVGSLAETEAVPELEGLSHRFPACRLVVSTRQNRMEQQLGELSLVAVQPLRPHDVLQYIQQYLGDPERSETVFRDLGGRDRAAWLQPDSLVSLARNPLMLNVILSLGLAGDSAVRPNRAAVLGAYSRHAFTSDLHRGSRLTPEVKETLLAWIACTWRREARLGPIGRGDLAQLVRDAIAELRAQELIPVGLDATTVLAEVDRRFLSPLLPEPGPAGQYEWSYQLFQDYFVALDLQRRHFPAGRLSDRRGLEELLAGEGWFRWASAAIFLSELLDDAGVVALIDTCLRADNLILTCRCLSHSIGNGSGRWRSAPGISAQRLAGMFRSGTADDEGAQPLLQDPYTVLCEALLEGDPGADDSVESLESCLGTAILASTFDVDAAGVSAALSLGLSEPEIRAVSWALGRDAREVMLLRSRLLRLTALPQSATSGEQCHLRQGLLLSLSGSPEVLLLELCRRAQALMNADRASAPHARALARDTAGVHAVLARTLGLWRLAGLLEDLCLYVLEPEEFEGAAAMAEDLHLVSRERRLDWFGDVLSEHLQAASIDADVQTAMPNLNGILSELRQLGERRLPRAALRGLGRIIINVPDDKDSSRVIAALEELWPGTAAAEVESVPLTPAAARQGRYELVAYPAEGDFVRLLVQAVPPDEIAPARRWPGDPVDHGPLRARMQRLRNTLAGTGDDERIFVLTAGGEIVALAKGSTPIDFAYHIHTRLGHGTSGSIINGREQPLTYQLQNGDRVHIVIDTVRKLPPGEWLERGGFLHTARARKAVQQALDSGRRADAVAFGRAIVMNELQRLPVASGLLVRLLKTLGFQREERLFEAAGRGDVSRREIAYTLSVLAGNDLEETSSLPLSVTRGIDRKDIWAPIVTGGAGLRSRYARCCRPQPGDPIRAYRTRQSVVIHHASCATGAAAATTHPPIEVRWPAPRGTGTVLVRICARKGRSVAPAIRRAAQAAGIDVVDLASSRAVDGDVTLTLECRADEERVKSLLAQLKRRPDVSSADVVHQESG